MCGNVRASRDLPPPTPLHPHDTTDERLWDVANHDLIQAHIADPIYTQEATKRRIEETGKRLKASIFVTQFDNLITNHLKTEGFEKDLQQHLGDTWTQIGRKEVDPMTFLEGIDIGVISKQLGHASISTTAKYLDHIAPTAVVQAIRGRRWVPEPSRRNGDGL